MGLTERHWFEDEEPELTENQLEDILWENNKIFERGYQKGFSDGKSALLREQEPATVSGWIPFKIRPLTDEEKDHHPGLIYMFDCPLPEDGQEILVSFLNGTVWVDEWSDDYCNECGLASGSDVEEGMAWMPIPEPLKEVSGK